MAAAISSLREALAAWERLRILYSVFVTSFLAWWVGYAPRWQELPGDWKLLVCFLGIANVFYCLGSLAEIYGLVFFGFSSTRLRVALFAFGVLISVGVVVVLFGRVSPYV